MVTTENKNTQWQILIRKVTINISPAQQQNPKSRGVGFPKSAWKRTQNAWFPRKKMLSCIIGRYSRLWGKIIYLRGSSKVVISSQMAKHLPKFNGDTSIHTPKEKKTNKEKTKQRKTCK